MSKKVTIYDIASRLNISTGTVNRALNGKPEVSEKTRTLVLTTAREMGFQINRAAKSLARNTIYLDFVICNHVSVFHDEIISGVRRAYMELNDFNIAGDVHVFRGADQDVRVRILEKMRELNRQGHQGILLLPPTDIRGYCEAIGELRDAGTYVATINDDIYPSRRLFALRKNAIMAGRMAAELLYWFAPTRQVAVCTGHSGALDHASSVDAFRQECAARRMRVVSVCENYDDPDFAAYNTEKLFKQHPQVEGIYVNSANSIAVCRKVVQLGLSDSVRIVASDVFLELVQMMRDGVVQATLFQDPFRQGHDAVKLLYRCIAEGETPPFEVLVNPRVVLRSNLEEYRRVSESITEQEC